MHIPAQMGSQSLPDGSVTQRITGTIAELTELEGRRPQRPQIEQKIEQKTEPRVKRSTRRPARTLPRRADVFYEKRQLSKHISLLYAGVMVFILLCLGFLLFGMYRSAFPSPAEPVSENGAGENMLYEVIREAPTASGSLNHK